MSRNFIILVLSLTLAGCRTPSGSEKRQVDQSSSLEVIDLSAATKKRRAGFENAPSVGVVSMLALVANPERYHGKRVIIHGYVTLKFEAQYIFPSPELALSTANGVWLEKDFGDLPNDDQMDLFPARIEGVFDAGGSGHLGMSTGELCFITRFEPMKQL